MAGLTCEQKPLIPLLARVAALSDAAGTSPRLVSLRRHGAAPHPPPTRHVVHTPAIDNAAGLACVYPPRMHWRHWRVSCSWCWRATGRDDAPAPPHAPRGHSGRRGTRTRRPHAAALPPAACSCPPAPAGVPPTTVPTGGTALLSCWPACGRPPGRRRGGTIASPASATSPIQAGGSWPGQAAALWDAAARSHGGAERAHRPSVAAVGPAACGNSHPRAYGCGARPGRGTAGRQRRCGGRRGAA